MQAPARCVPPEAACSMAMSGRAVKNGRGSTSAGARVKISGRRQEARRNHDESSVHRNGGFGHLEDSINASYRGYASPSESATSVSDFSSCGDRTVPPSFDSSSASSRSASPLPDLFVLKPGAPSRTHAAASPANGIDLRVAKAISRSASSSLESAAAFGVGSRSAGAATLLGGSSNSSNSSPAVGAPVASPARRRLLHEPPDRVDGRAAATGTRPSGRQAARQPRRETCDWCGACPANVIVSDATDAASEQPLRFCGEPCVNRYKMEVFCSETIEQLRKIEETGSTSVVTAVVSGGSGASNRIVITPELWSQRPKQPPPPLLHRRTSGAAAVSPQLPPQQPLPPPQPLPAPPSLPLVPTAVSRRRLALFERHLAVDVGGRCIGDERTLDAVRLAASTTVAAPAAPIGAAATSCPLPPSLSCEQPPLTLPCHPSESARPPAEAAALATVATDSGTPSLVELRRETGASTRSAASKRKLPHEDTSFSKYRIADESSIPGGENRLTAQPEGNANARQSEPSMRATPATCGQLIAAAAAAASAAVAAAAAADERPGRRPSGVAAAALEQRGADDTSRAAKPPPNRLPLLQLPPQLPPQSQEQVLKGLVGSGEQASTTAAATPCYSPIIEKISTVPVATACDDRSAAATAACTLFGLPLQALLALIPCPMIIPVPVPIPIPIPMPMYDKNPTPPPR